MKTMFRLLIVLMAFQMSSFVNAQTAEEIVSNYLELIGGEEKILAIQSSATQGMAKAQGMEIPIIMTSKMPSSQRLDIIMQGQTMTQFSFDGEVGWATNFMTLEAEKMESQEAAIFKAQLDFPDPFAGFKEKGFSVTKEEDESIEGSDCYQIKLTKKPIMVDEKEVPNVAYYFFDKDSNALLMTRMTALSGQMKGMDTEIYFSDYEEVDGIYFPMTISQKMNGQTAFSMTISEIILNGEIDDKLFAFPEKVAVPAMEK